MVPEGTIFVAIVASSSLSEGGATGAPAPLCRAAAAAAAASSASESANCGGAKGLGISGDRASTLTSLEVCTAFSTDWCLLSGGASSDSTLAAADVARTPKAAIAQRAAGEMWIA